MAVLVPRAPSRSRAGRPGAALRRRPGGRRRTASARGARGRRTARCAHVRRGERRCDVLGGDAVPGDLQVLAGGDGRAAEPAGDAAAARHIDLQAVHGPGRAHPLGVLRTVGVLTGGDVAPQLPAQQRQPGQVVGGHRLLEPDDAQLVVPGADAAALAGGVAAVGVHHDLHVVADELAGQCGAGEVARRVATPVLPDLDLDRSDPLLSCPGGQLRAELVVGQRDEAAAAVDRDAVAAAAEQPVQRQVKQLGLEVPQCEVDRGDRHADQAGPAGVADRPVHGRERPWDVEGVAADHHVGEQGADHLQRGGRGAARPTEAADAAGDRFDDEQLGGRPGGGAVSFGCRRRDPVGGQLQLPDRGVHVRPLPAPVAGPAGRRPRAGRRPGRSPT